MSSSETIKKNRHYDLIKGRQEHSNPSTISESSMTTITSGTARINIHFPDVLRLIKLIF